MYRFDHGCRAGAAGPELLKMALGPFHKICLNLQALAALDRSGEAREGTQGFELRCTW
jgi:hypothetical protein